MRNGGAGARAVASDESQAAAEAAKPLKR